MALLDTSAVILRYKKQESIDDDITIVTVIEFPRIMMYKKFTGRVLFPTMDDYVLAYRLQVKLHKMGNPQSFADLLIAAITINRNETLVTADEDFIGIAEAANRLEKS